MSLCERDEGNVGDVEAEVEGELSFDCVINLSSFQMMVLLPHYLFRDYVFWSLHKITHKFMISHNIFQCSFNISTEIFGVFKVSHKILLSLFSIL